MGENFPVHGERCPVCNEEKIWLLTSKVCAAGCLLTFDEADVSRASPMGVPEEVRAGAPRLKSYEEWIPASLFSTLEIGCNSASKSSADWRLFEYSRSMAMPESGRLAQRAHTNLPRPGSSGLPHGWEARVFGWRAVLDVTQMSPVVRAWMMETSLELIYNSKFIFSMPLGDFFAEADFHQPKILVGTRSLAETVRFQDNLSFHVNVESNLAATRHLRDHLNGRFSDDVNRSGVPSAIARLETIAALAGDGVGQQIRQALSTLAPKSTLMLRVHLDCFLKRCIV